MSVLESTYNTSFTGDVIQKDALCVVRDKFMLWFALSVRLVIRYFDSNY